jgi:hypothetical protein
MRTSKPWLMALLALGLSSTALAQTAPANPGNMPSSGSSPTPPTQSTNTTRVGRMHDGSNIGNNRDRLSPGTGTPTTSPRSMTTADGQPVKSKSSAHKSKDKMKSKPVR